MSDGEILVHEKGYDIQQNVDQFSSGLTNYLQILGLPSDKVLVKVDERRKVISNLPDVVNLLDEESKLNAFYISKFIAACSAGLFDAALNFIWNETVANLRSKVVRFDLEYFFNSVVTDSNRRKKLRSAEDLEKIDDWELIRGCHLTGVLSNVGFQHLDYIRNMRNWASAAHPNQNELTGLQVISWLETCIIEVIGREPSGPVIEVKRLLHNIRNEILSPNDIGQISANIEMLPSDLAKSLIRTIFGMYTDPDMSAAAKNNIRFIAQHVWNVSPDEAKYEIGVKYATFAANAEVARKDSAHDFLTSVNGLTFLPQDTLTVELDEKINNLYDAHTGFNNFHNEPAHARIITKYIPETGSIPDAVRAKYLKTLVMCKIGNGYGFSWDAISYYDMLIERFQEQEIQIVVYLVTDREISSRLQFTQCADSYKYICIYLRNRTVNPRTISALDQICNATSHQLPNIGKSTEMKRILGIIKNQ